VSEADSADVTAAGRRTAPEIFSEDADLTAPTSDHQKSEREGLPPGYRMRADAHYVEQLTSRRTDRHADVPRVVARREAAEPEGAVDIRERRDPRDRRTEKILAQLTEDVATIESLSAVLASGLSALARRTSLDLVRAHAWRASWLLRAGAILDGSHRAPARPVQVAALLGQIREGFAAESRLAGFALHLRASDWGAEISVDQPAFVAALSGAIVATLGLAKEGGIADVRLTLVAGPGDLQTVEVSQDDAELMQSSVQRFFDPTWAERPGGWVAGLGAATARAVVQQNGGEALCLAGDGRGSTLRLTFSRPS
jgi:hypothetical protein